MHPMNVDYKMIGTRIKHARKNKNMTQEALAEHLDVSIGYISQVERGITKISLNLLGSIAHILECDIADLIRGSAVDSEKYMEAEFITEFKKLDKNKRKFILGIIRLLEETL